MWAGTGPPINPCGAAPSCEGAEALDALAVVVERSKPGDERGEGEPAVWGGRVPELLERRVGEDEGVAPRGVGVLLGGVPCERRPDISGVTANEHPPQQAEGFLDIAHLHRQPDLVQRRAAVLHRSRLGAPGGLGGGGGGND